MKCKTHGIKILTITLTALLASLIFVPTGFAQVGVEVGDWAKYEDFSPYLWNLSWDQPDYWPKNNTEWVNMTVQSVSGSTVTVEATTYSATGTEAETLSGDVETGSGNLGFFLIRENLADGLEVPWNHTKVTGTGCEGITLFITGSLSRSYAGAVREVNYVNASFVGLGPTRVNLTAYWDKATGVLCEISMSVKFGPLGYAGIEALTSFKIAETNMWGPIAELTKELDDLKDEYATLQQQLDATESNLEEAEADLEAAEEATSMWQMLTIVMLIVGLAVGFVIAWVVKKPKTKPKK